MPRIARKDITSLYLHVMAQGIRKEKIFNKDSLKKFYINLLLDNLNEYSDLKIISYCVMDNHVHLLFYCKDVNQLSNFMTRVNTTFAINYNKIGKRVGYVFRNRFHVQQIKDEAHLRNCLVYIHNNPVKANIVKSMEQYRFSSYNAYVNQKIDESIIKLLFGNQKNYLDVFNEMHIRLIKNGINNVFDIEKENINLLSIEKMTQEFCELNFCDVYEICNNNFLLIKFVEYAKANSNILDKEIAQYLKIGKNKITRIRTKNGKLE